MELRPSASKFWTRCAGQPRMVASLPEKPPSEPAMEGTCAAWLAEQVLTGQAEQCADLLGAQHPENHWVVDSDMVRHIQRYVDLVRSYGGEIVAERFVRLTDTIAGTPDCYGIITDVDDQKTLVVIDLKYGYGIVEADFNTQCMIYAGAIMNQPDTPFVNRVVIGIFQPRAAHCLGEFRTWSVEASRLIGLVEGIKEKSERCQAVDPIVTPGPHCKDCDAIPTCFANAAYAYDLHLGASVSQQRHLTPQELANELDFLDEALTQIESRKSAIEAEAEERSRRETIPSYGVTETRGQRKFKYDAAVISALTGVNAHDTKVCTPAELIRRGANEDAIAPLVTRPVKRKLQKLPEGYWAAKFGGSK